ncbi:MAG: DUF881 domain-containing protein [Tissierellia bacterium]|nr:DUF881 domain-containing protein [Tissierellia bacterium]
MNNTKKPNFTILFFSIILGIFMAGQFKQNIPILAPVTISSIQAMQNEINAVNKEIEDVKKLTVQRTEQLRILESIALGDEDIIDILETELQNTKIASGLKEVEGPGIIVRMEDNMSETAFGQEYDLDLIHDIDVLRVINDLKGAGAEAISINGQRILSISEIKCRGPVIKVNDKSVAVPFVIKAIGDPKLLNAAINAPNTYAYALRTIDQLNIETTIEDHIVVPEYNGRFNFSYAKPLKEGD